MSVRPAGARRLALAVATAAVPAVILTGCAASETSGRALGDGTPSACAVTGSSADAAGATVRCYLGALATSDTTTACSVLSQRVRAHLADQATGGDYDPAFHVPDGSDQGMDSDCSSVAPMMRRALDALSSADLARFRTAVNQVTVGAATVDGATASLTITATGSSSAGRTIALVQDGGRWMIDSTSAFSLAS